MTIDLTEIVIVFIGLVFLIATGVLIPVTKTVIIPWIKSKITEKQLTIIRTVVKIAICAAQQLFSKEEIVAKKEYALKQVETMLAKYNITLSTDEISTYIEGILKDIKTEIGAEWSNE